MLESDNPLCELVTVHEETPRGASERYGTWRPLAVQPPRTGADVLIGGKRVGEVTSGNLSPVLGHGIALAFLPLDTVTGTDLEIDMRGRPAPARVVELPFVHKKG